MSRSLCLDSVVGHPKRCPYKGHGVAKPLVPRRRRRHGGACCRLARAHPGVHIQDGVAGPTLAAFSVPRQHIAERWTEHHRVHAVPSIIIQRGFDPAGGYVILLLAGPCRRCVWIELTS